MRACHKRGPWQKEAFPNKYACREASMTVDATEIGIWSEAVFLHSVSFIMVIFRWFSLKRKAFGGLEITYSRRFSDKNTPERPLSRTWDWSDACGVVPADQILFPRITGAFICLSLFDDLERTALCKRASSKPQFLMRDRIFLPSG